MRIAAVTIGIVVAASVSCGTSVPDGVSDVRVCAERAFDQGEKACREDQRNTRLVAEAFYCSARVGNRGGEQFAGRWFYEGDSLFEGSETIPEDASSITVHARLANVVVGEARWSGPLPGGRYRCALSVAGEERSVNLVSGGSTVARVSVCSQESATIGGGACARDESGRPLRTRAITCSALLADAKGVRVRFEFLRGGRIVAANSAGALPAPLASVYQNVSNLAPGSWTCRIVVRGKAVAAKPFTVG